MLLTDVPSRGIYIAKVTIGVNTSGSGGSSVIFKIFLGGLAGKGNFTITRCKNEAEVEFYGNIGTIETCNVDISPPKRVGLAGYPHCTRPNIGIPALVGGNISVPPTG